MPNYQQGVIYTIRSRSREDLIYIGSTTQKLSTRFGKHKGNASRCSSRQIIELGDAYIELLETYPCNNRNELVARENFHMRSIDCVNKRSAIDDCSHGRQQAMCIECNGKSICEHKRRKWECKECGGGSQICQHDKRIETCKICSPINCGFCNETHTKGTFKRHLSSKKHQNNYIAEYLRVFDEVITADQVPLFYVREPIRNIE
jgi:hypothetical protein